ncbi:MAG: hypothetical protein ABIR32_13440 [Ilumatobacteraceae bacterium]
MKKTLAAVLVLGGLSLGLPTSGALSASLPESRPGIPLSESVKPIRVGTIGDHTDTRPTETASLRPEGIAGGYVFVPINPFRALDSRDYVDGYLFAGDTWAFDVISDQSGGARIPTGAVAVTYNLTVTDTSGGGGYIAIYPANIDWPGNSSVNWTASGTTLANGGTVAIGNFNGPGKVEVYVGPAGGPTGTDFLIDITGYYI